MNFHGSPAQLQTQIRNLLADHGMFEFVCDHLFSPYDQEGSGALTLPVAAPMIQDILKLLGQSDSSDAVYAVWQAHCDPTMRHMTAAQFRPFVRSLFQGYLDGCDSAKEKSAVMQVQAVVAPPQMPVAFPAEQSALAKDGRPAQLAGIGFRGRSNEAGRRSPKARTHPRTSSLQAGQRSGQVKGGYPDGGLTKGAALEQQELEPLKPSVVGEGAAPTPPAPMARPPVVGPAAPPEVQVPGAAVGIPACADKSLAAPASITQQERIISGAVVQDARTSPPPPGHTVPNAIARVGIDAATWQKAPVAPAQAAGGGSGVVVQDIEAKLSPQGDVTSSARVGGTAGTVVDLDADVMHASAGGGCSNTEVPAEAVVSSAQRFPAQAVVPHDPLSQAFAALHHEAFDLIKVARSHATPSAARDHSEGRATVFDSLDSALRFAYRLLVDELAPKGLLFKDPEFGPTDEDPEGMCALHRRNALPAGETTEAFGGPDGICWLRPGRVRSVPEWPPVFAGERCIVRAGVFNDSWLIGALGTLAAVDETSLFGEASGCCEPFGVYPRVFWDPELRRHGLYCFRFNKYGRWVYVVVDDQLPFSKPDQAPLFAQATSRDCGATLLWVPLIEKAYAKLHGAYEALSQGLVDDALADLTSWPVDKIQVSKYAKPAEAGTTNKKPKDPAELWSSLKNEFSAGAAMACSASGSAGGAETGGVDAAAGVGDQFVRVDGDGVHVNTGIQRNFAYAVPLLQEVWAGEGGSQASALQVVQLRDLAGAAGGVGRVGPYNGDGGRQLLDPQGDLWRRDPAVAAQLRASAVAVGRSLFLAPPRESASDGGGNGLENGDDEGDNFAMRFEVWLQVFTHVFVCRPLTPAAGWQTIRLDGRWTPRTCGGTPIPVKRVVPATPESWARNPQCRLLLLDATSCGSGEFNGSDVDALPSHVEVCVSLMQPDARMSAGSAFPFWDRLLELFICIMQLKEPGERLSVFDKTRIPKQGGASLISRRREVLLRLRLPAPGSYAVVPSTWEPQLSNLTNEAPFLLSLYVRCPPGRFRMDAPPAEGWTVLEA